MRRDSCLVTGYGFVSRHLVERLEALGADVTVIEKNPACSYKNTIFADLRYLKDSLEFDYVFHMAAIAFPKYAEENRLEAYEANILSTIRLLDVVKCKRFIFPSTGIVYSPEIPNPKESNEVDPLSIYACTKLACEQIIRHDSKLKNLQYNIARFGNMYGPGQSKGYVVRDIIEKMLSSNLIELRNASVERDFLYVKDGIDALIHLAQIEECNEVFNVATGKLSSLRSIAETLIELSGENISLTDLKMQEKYVVEAQRLDISKILETDWKPRVSLQAGLKETLESMRGIRIAV